MASNRKSTKHEINSLLTPEQIGLSSEKYQAAIKYLFDRPDYEGSFAAEWFWNTDEPEFDATPREWVLIQTVMFARAGEDLQRYNDEQVGTGLKYIMDGGISNVSLAIFDDSVSEHERLLMLNFFPNLWRHCIGPRLKDVFDPIGAVKRGRLGYVCYMWFDVWPAGYTGRADQAWTKALWNVFKELLTIDVREVQIAALHGIGHCAIGMGFDAEIKETVRDYRLNLDNADDELKSYAKAAANGAVQ
jgi:hypothetical protein